MVGVCSAWGTCDGVQNVTNDYTGCFTRKALSDTDSVAGLLNFEMQFSLDMLFGGVDLSMRWYYPGSPMMPQDRPTNCFRRLVGYFNISVPPSRLKGQRALAEPD